MTINVDNPNGFTPIGTMSGSPWNSYVRAFEVDAAAANIFMGDMVIMEADGRVAPAAAGSQHLLGVCVGSLQHVAAPVAASGKMDGNFMANSSPTLAPSYSAGAGWILVAVGTDILYEVQEDGDTDSLEVIDVGLNVELIATHSGSTLTGRSAQEINSDSHTTDSAQFRLIGVADKPNNQPYDVDTTQNGTARWIVRINESHYNLVTAPTTTLAYGGTGL